VRSSIAIIKASSFSLASFRSASALLLMSLIAMALKNYSKNFVMAI